MKNSLPKISIIVPVYNAEQHVSYCLDSLINQSYPNIEIICVNDGSTDNSLSILKEYANRDSRVKIYTQHNFGAPAARNAGLKISTGEYIWFVDADDWCELDAIYTIVNNLQERNPDVIVFGANIISKFKKEFSQYHALSAYNKFNVINAKTHPQIIFNMPHVLWNKFFSHKYIKQYALSLDEELKFCDDNLFSLKALVMAERILLIHKNLYNYVKDTNNSLTRNKKNDIYHIKYAEKADLFMAPRKEENYYINYVNRKISGLLYFAQKNTHKFYKKLKKYLVSQNTNINKYYSNNSKYNEYILITTFSAFLLQFMQMSTNILRLRILGINILKFKITKKNENIVIKGYLFGILFLKKITSKYHKSLKLFGLGVYNRNTIGIHERHINKPNCSYLKNLKNKFKDKGRLFIIGNAPSINKLDLTKLNNEYTFVVSRGYLMKEHGLNHASFYCISDHTSYQNYGKEIDTKYADYYFASTWSGWKHKLKNVGFFDLSNDTEISRHNFFQFDICQPLSLGRTVVLDALQLAVYMGFKEIYFIGVDLDFNKQERHFYISNSQEQQNQHIEWATNNEQRMLDNFKVASQILKAKGISIYNAGIGGKLNVIPRVNFNDLFGEKK